MEVKFWQLEDERVLQLQDLVVWEIDFIDFTKVAFSSAQEKKYFANNCFLGGKRLHLTGKISLPHLPAHLSWNLFQHVGVIASPDVAKSFKSLVPRQIQLFPIAHKENPEKFYYVNVVKALDCIDMERSGAEYNEAGRPYAVRRLVLREDRIPKSAKIFTLTFLRGIVIVRHDFMRELTSRHRIKGTEFVPVPHV